MEDPISYLRPEVLAFAIAMERELRANDYKGGWKECDSASLLQHLDEEVYELTEEAMKSTSENVLSEAADVANLAMMVADVMGGLRHAYEKE